jgi:hypothetical protein
VYVPGEKEESTGGDIEDGCVEDSKEAERASDEDDIKPGSVATSTGDEDIEAE